MASTPTASRMPATPAAAPTLSLRNVARYGRDVHANVPLYEAIGFTLSGDAKDVKAHLEAAGWKLLRSPHEGDVGYFIIYGDLDGNPINLVGKPLKAAPAPGTVRLVLRDGKAVAEPVPPVETAKAAPKVW